MDENNKVVLEVGQHTDALSIASTLVHYFRERRSGNGLFTTIEGDTDAYEDIRMVGEALLSVYRAYERANEVREKYRR